MAHRPLKVLTVSTQFASLGGAEAILRGHHDHDAAHGLDSRFLIYWEPEHPGWPRTRFLNLDTHMSVRQARKRFQAAHPGFAPDVAVYHTVWGWPYFADLDRAPRRLLYLHSDFPGLEAQLHSRLQWIDGVLCVSESLLGRVQQLQPALFPDRALQVQASIDPPSLPPSTPRAPVSPEHPLVIGYCGRIVHEQKRVDRLIPFVQGLQAAGIPFRFELLGEGPARAELEQSLPSIAPGQVLFHGRQSGPDYWRILAGWDAILFVSDYEGTPLALLEAMAAGVFPIHPDLESGGDRTALHVDPRCVYRPGDIPGAIATCQWLAAQQPPQMAHLRLLAQTAVQPHLGAGYRGAFANFLQRIIHLPPLPKAPLPRRPFPIDWLTFHQTELLARLRRRLRPGSN